jgi:putative ABC transport system permease protein
MLKLVYLYRNLTRNMLRTGLTCAAVALPIMIYVLSSAVIDGLERFLDNSAKQLRLVVVHKASIINPLPLGYRAKIEALDPTKTRITAVCGMRWIGGKIQNQSQPLSTLAAQPDTFVATFPDQRLADDEIEAWYRDRRAIIVGDATARQLGWQKGSRISIHPSVPPYSPMEFNVISTAPNALDKITNFCRLDYLEEELKRQITVTVPGWTPDGWVSFLFVKCATRADLDYFRLAIDELFARSGDETKTQDEKSFMMEFINQIFNLPQNLAILSAVTIFVAVMAAANTMSMNIRDRLNEMATLKSMGFSAGSLFRFIQSESLLLCALGGAIGAAVPFVAFNYTPLRNYQVPLIQNLEVHLSVCLQSLTIAVIIGLFAAAWPAWSAARLHVVSALRNLE